MLWTYKLEGRKEVIFKIFSPFLLNYGGRYRSQIHFYFRYQLRLIPVVQSIGLDAISAPARDGAQNGRGPFFRELLFVLNEHLVPPTILPHEGKSLGPSPDKWKLQGRKYCWGHWGWAAASSSYSSKPTQWASLSWNIHNSVTGKVSPEELSMGQHKSIFFWFPVVRSCFHMSHASYKDNQPWVHSVQEPSQTKEDHILIFPESLLVFTWCICWSAMGKMQNESSCQWPRDCPYPVTASIDLSSNQGMGGSPWGWFHGELKGKAEKTAPHQWL